MGHVAHATVAMAPKRLCLNCATCLTMAKISRIGSWSWLRYSAVAYTRITEKVTRGCPCKYINPFLKFFVDNVQKIFFYFRYRRLVGLGSGLVGLVGLGFRGRGPGGLRCYLRLRCYLLLLLVGVYY